MARSTLPYDPRRDEVADKRVIAELGRATLATVGEQRRLWSTLVQALASPFTPGPAAAEAVRHIILTQILFTGYQALPLVGAIGFMIGGTIIVQTTIMAPMATGDLLGRVLVAVVLREMAPLATAIIVAGRSGTAIATELGNMKANTEILALSSLGVDPPRYVVLPRMIGAVVSVMVLTVYFSAVAVIGGYVTSRLIASPSFDTLRTGFVEGILPGDLPLFLAKSTGLGTLVGWLSCHFGLQVKSSPTEVPRQASRAVVMILLGCFVYNTLVTGVFYAIVGPPVQGGFP